MRHAAKLDDVRLHDPVDHRALGDECEDPHRGTTGRAQERVHFVDAPQELGPAPPCLRIVAQTSAVAGSTYCSTPGGTAISTVGGCYYARNAGRE